ncbi:MAG: aminotransferase DegT [Methanobacteriota archaeon]|nr:MAG: aminotransferase DegT [Euryarchaeota archaeon]HIL32853.1 DegT/DnrJ/EryC1/StrS aminotransferase family protein [Candidatus Poseidoniales archaeon]
MIPIAKPLIGDEEQREVARVLGSGSLAQGPEVAAFEAEFAAYCGTKHALATTNGTTALHLALLAAGVSPGDEVITTPFSFFASASSIRMAGAKPVFVDLERDGYTLDPAAVVAAITPRTKAVMPVHLYGELCDMDALREACDTVPIIEDACQAHGADAGGRAGSHGLAGCFSFYPTKNMTTGEGGMVTTDDDDVAAVVAQLRAHGQGERYEHLQLGFNYRMTDIAAAIGRVQLRKLDGYNEARRANARRYSAALADCVQVPTERRGHVFHQYTIQSDVRDALREHLTARGIGSGIYYPTLLYEARPLAEFAALTPRAAALPARVLSLPVHPDLSEEDVGTVIDAVRDFAPTA